MLASCTSLIRETDDMKDGRFTICQKSVSECAKFWMKIRLIVWLIAHLIIWVTLYKSLATGVRKFVTELQLAASLRHNYFIIPDYPKPNW